MVNHQTTFHHVFSSMCDHLCCSSLLLLLLLSSELITPVVTTKIPHGFDNTKFFSTTTVTVETTIVVSAKISKIPRLTPITTTTGAAAAIHLPVSFFSRASGGKQQLKRYHQILFVSPQSPVIVRQEKHHSTWTRRACYKTLQESSLAPFRTVAKFSSPSTVSTSTIMASSNIEKESTTSISGTTDALFGWIEATQKNEPWGDILDAGTGSHSIRWLIGLLTMKYSTVTTVTAITADANMKRTVQSEVRRTLLLLQQQQQKENEENRLKQQQEAPDDPPKTSSLSEKMEQSTIVHENDDNYLNEDYEDKCNILIGNWFSSNHQSHSSASSSSIEKQLHKKRYKTIIADYLIGAMDGFSPYQQDCMIPKLLQHLVDDDTEIEGGNSAGGGRLYIIGLEPIPDAVVTSEDDKNDDDDVDNNENNAKNIICKVRQVRDACILLAGHRCYREYPLEWIIRQLDNYNNQKYLTNYQSQAQQQQQPNNVRLEYMVQRFPIVYRYETVLKQISVARTKLPYFSNQQLVSSMTTVLDDLQDQCRVAFERTPRVVFGFDYVVCVEKKLKEK